MHIEIMWTVKVNVKARGGAIVRVNFRTRVKDWYRGRVSIRFRLGLGIGLESGSLAAVWNNLES